MKISVGQLRKIIREEVEQEKVRKIVRETIKSELDEGAWDNIKSLASATFTGKVDGKAIPPGVSKGDWVMIMNSAKTLPAERQSAFIADSTLQVKETPGRITSAKSWLKNIESQEEEEAENATAQAKRAEYEELARKAKEEDDAKYYRAKAQLKADRLEREESEEREREAQRKREEKALLARQANSYGRARTTGEIR